MIYLLGLLFLSGGIMHFVRPGIYIKMMPAYLPAHRELVLISGVFEVLGAIGLCFGPEPWNHYAAWGLIALLIAVFPANYNMATHPQDWPKMKPAFLWARAPLQLVLIAWVYNYT